jgi:rubredoxin
MSFLCPECSTSKSLKISLKIELPPDSRSDEIQLQAVRCSRCGFAAIAVYEESRRGALGRESFQHVGYRVSADDLKAVRKLMTQCPEPGNARCGCSVHRRLGRTDASGRWDGLRYVHREGRFNLEL